MSNKADSSSGIVLPPLRRHLHPRVRCCNTFSLPGRQLPLRPPNYFNTSRCFSLPFFMALVSVFLGQGTLVFYFFLLMACLQYNKKHQERRIWDVFYKVLNLTTLNHPSRLLVLFTNTFCVKPPHDALHFREHWIQDDCSYLCEEANSKLQLSGWHLLPDTRF